MGTALVNADNDWDVVFMQKDFSHPDFAFRAPWVKLWDTPERMMLQLKMAKDIDIIHVHNEPTWMASVAKMIRPDLPVILDCHDLDTIRGETGHMEEEVDAFKKVDGFIFPSKAYSRLAKKHFKFKQASEIIYSMVNDELFFPPEQTKIPGVMYQGGIGVKGNTQDFNYRDFSVVAEVLRDAGIPFHLYCGHDHSPILNHYGNLSCVMHPRVQYTTLMQEQTRYDWGLIGTDIKSHQWDASAPNKLFEYILSGLPIICLNAKEPAEWVEAYDIGVVIKDPAEIPSIYHLHEEKKANVLKVRDQFCMEDQIPKLVKLYERLIRK